MTDARVEQLDVAVFTVPLEKPESDGTLTWDSTTAIVVEASGSGRRGLGYTYGARACAALVDEMLREVAVGSDAMDVTGTWAEMVRSVRNLGRLGVASMAIAAVDTALWDLKARLLGVPLCS